MAGEERRRLCGEVGGDNTEAEDDEEGEDGDEGSGADDVRAMYTEWSGDGVAAAGGEEEGETRPAGRAWKANVTGRLAPDTVDVEHERAIDEKEKVGDDAAWWWCWDMDAGDGGVDSSDDESADEVVDVEAAEWSEVANGWPRAAAAATLGAA